KKAAPNAPDPNAQTDLSKIDRRIAKEPVYQTKTPKYCLLVFGPEAKHRIWLVLDGDTLYVDRNGNGDLTEKSEKVAVPKFNKVQERQIMAGNISTSLKTQSQLVLMQMKIAKDAKPSTAREAEFLAFLGDARDRLVTTIMIRDDLGKEKGVKPLMHLAG